MTIPNTRSWSTLADIQAIGLDMLSRNCLKFRVFFWSSVSRLVQNSFGHIEVKMKIEDTNSQAANLQSSHPFFQTFPNMCNADLPKNWPRKLIRWFVWICFDGVYRWRMTWNMASLCHFKWWCHAGELSRKIGKHSVVIYPDGFMHHNVFNFLVIKWGRRKRTPLNWSESQQRLQRRGDESSAFYVLKLQTIGVFPWSYWLLPARKPHSIFQSNLLFSLAV